MDFKVGQINAWFPKLVWELGHSDVTFHICCIHRFFIIILTCLVVIVIISIYVYTYKILSIKCFLIFTLLLNQILSSW